jgi:hypothetical protein
MISRAIIDRWDYNFLEPRNETVSTLWDGLDEPRIFRRIAQGFAKPHDGGVQAVVKIDEGICRPETMLQLIPADNSTPMIEEQEENLEGLLL